MRISNLVSVLAVTAGVVSAGRSLKHVGRQDKPQKHARQPPQPAFLQQRDTSSAHLTDRTRKYSVNGRHIPEVDFDIGESYAGLLPISKNRNETRELYFWFFPSENPHASDEILIWLNGGPGCSSLEGLLQENGPFLWQYGTYKPVPNPYTWTNLTNVVWVEQPVGTGFSQGVPSARNEEDVAAQFLGFWENFVETFDLQNRKIFITGESYAGYFVPYIADAMLNKNDTCYYNLEATMIYDPSTTYDVIANDIPVVPFVDYWRGLMPFNDTFNAQIHNVSDSCGYTDFLSTYLTFPPPGPFPSPENLPGYKNDNCDVYDLIYNEVFNINPCWDVYQVATTCPILWDVLGFPGSIPYLPDGANVYFNRTDVQRAINAPHMDWEECSSQNVFVHDGDTSPPSGVSVLPGVIERSKRTIIAHGSLDMVLLANGTLLMIQNMTWGGKQGFQVEPTAPFYVPYHDDPSLSTLSASGVMGTTHTERGLTWVSQDLSGHMIPQYQPSSSYRHLEFLLGRIDSLSSTVPFTTDPFVQSTQPLGNGTAPPPPKRERRGYMTL